MEKGKINPHLMIDIRINPSYYIGTKGDGNPPDKKDIPWIMWSEWKKDQLDQLGMGFGFPSTAEQAVCSSSRYQDRMVTRKEYLKLYHDLRLYERNSYIEDSINHGLSMGQTNRS